MVNFQTTIIKKFIAISLRNWHRGSIDEQRTRQERLSGAKMPNPDITFQPVQIGVLAAEWVRPPQPAGTILYLHGGAYALGSIKTHRNLTATLANATGMQVLLINYRLAPEHPYPAGLEDAVQAYNWLLGQNIPPKEIVIAGDSAGGGLTLTALLSLRNDGVPLPAAAVLLSPWTDLTMTGESIKSKAQLDIVLDADHLLDFARLYAGEHDLNHPLISPLFADLTGLPPLLIQVGTDEILLDDSHRLAKLADEAGVKIQLDIFDGMIHVFHMFPFFKEAGQAFASIAEFCALVNPTGKAEKSPL